MMAGAQSMLAAVFVCAVANLVSAIAQVFRFHCRREIWIWWSHWDTPTWWSFIQVLCYIIGSIVTIVLWQRVPSVSSVALQCLLGVCWLNSLSGQYLMIHAIFKDNDRASLVCLPSAISAATYIAGFGMMQSSSGKVSWIGACLLFSSTLLFYLIAGISVNSIYLNAAHRSFKSVTFMSVFTAASVALVVSGGVTFSEENHCPFLLGLSIVGSSAYFLLMLQQPFWRLLSYAGYKTSPHCRSSNLEAGNDNQRSFTSTTQLASLSAYPKSDQLPIETRCMTKVINSPKSSNREEPWDVVREPECF